MFADLKQKAAGIDRKRLYTAAATILIAGAAGHFMQRSAQSPGDNPSTMAGALPTSASVMGPTIAPAPDASDASQAAATIVETPVAPDELPVPAKTPAAPTLEEPAVDPMIASAEANDPLVEEVTRGKTAMFGFEEDPAPDTTAMTEPAAAPSEPESDTEALFAALDSAEQSGGEPEIAPATSPEANCDISFKAEPAEAAMVTLSFEAPCHSGEDVGIDHGDLRFSEQLGPDGSLMILAPVMSATAIFTARLGDGQTASTEVRVPDFASYERIAVVWKGATGFQLHALENGAVYGEPGHVWAEQPGTAEMAIAGAGGFVSILGSSASGYAADVYTYPAGLTADDPGPEISIEAQVMENTCGTQIAGTILRSNAIGTPNVDTLSMSVPGCDAVGEYLVLKNLPQELKLARN
ncbi:hypothetical protein [Maritimibacter sp. HL-12]|uniref:hypothetical protein n=1 Tax=Maritimibacter sp. HL-12 TaxID=1162418 RepID=UPI000A0F075D|nr:hypothetical protein [Maritimibacter sp. HL-12]SMH45304.1 hypothetical protein SAMN05661107_1590 [Maritimibacter sp. HL-12]